MKFTFNLEERNTYSYTSYRKLIDQLVEKQQTTGSNQTEAYLNYTQLNAHRMNRLDKRVTLQDDLIQLLTQEQEQTWLVLTEAWCGDAAQNLPVIAKMASQNENIHLKLLLRDENLDIMDAYLTDGRSRSIPKLISFAADGTELFTWGPRPASIQQLNNTLRSGEMAYNFISEKIQLAYARNKTLDLQEEFKRLLLKNT